MDISNKTIYYSAQNALRLEWPAERSVKYGVLITFTDGEEECNEVKYQVQITKLKPSAEGLALFQINRITEVFVNETLPDLVTDRLAYTAGNVFYPLVITVDENGGFQSIFNHEEIIKRWSSVKNKILNEFEGSLTESYVEQMEKQITNLDALHLALSNNDWFIQTFFKPIYKEYGENRFLESIYKFPIVKDFKIDGYLTTEKLCGETNDFGGIELLHVGTIMPMKDELYFANRAKGDYEGYYLLHPKYKRIISVVSNLNYSDQEKTSVNVKITMIPENELAFDHDFKLDTNIAVVPITKMVIIDGHNGNKKGFWSRLLDY